MKEVRFGFVGAGKISHFSAESLKSHPRARLVAVQDLSKERVAELADKFDIEHRFTEATQLFACPEVDAVYIAVPNKFHATLAIEAMKAGKHVLLEKPFAMDASEAADVIRVSKETGRVFTVGMNQRYNADSQKIKAIAQTGALGEVYYAKAYWFRREGIPKLGTWFGNKAMAGAGAINDIGVHLLDLCLHTMGNFDPVSVYGTTYTKFGNRGLGEGGWGISDATETTFDVDDLASAMIKMRNGATVCLEVSWAAHIADSNRMNVELFGTEMGASLYPAKLYKRNDPLNADYQIVDNVAANPALEHCDRFHNFANHLLDGEALLVTAEEALVVQKILDAVAQSTRTGKSVNL
ncbi:Gfo/Idh/MocA family oxidoreductase [Pelagicoccus sp. NFK12]|uniref:Gfo/Idh/MocA family oxidoreductase n=1 Tax=Pelagicoccus enzymogenes TaxID=2773457 RepID=A0A927FBX9_9BACT|nr:Gfo/Idh/MocA family oxidoreductase [Pelagicoccus enzymogenes]MBD5781511.1 Gfo/Idh/MocA family oxidoreductase [Pelagicoccus enzymogenes]MDQ8199110.1 Gfo/Idh/MocA family oxidoreductase [Pelagicoccus enzymogenes]